MYLPRVPASEVTWDSQLLEAGRREIDLRQVFALNHPWQQFIWIQLPRSRHLGSHWMQASKVNMLAVLLIAHCAILLQRQLYSEPSHSPISCDVIT